MTEQTIQSKSGSLTVLDRPLDNTALAAFNRCPRLYDYSMRRDMRKDGSPSAALWYGSLWHVIMEWHYRTGGLADIVQQKALEWTLKPGNQPASFDDYRSFERAMVEYKKYVQKYGLPHEEQLKTVGYPAEPMIEMAVTLMDGGLIYPYTGKIDRIVERDGLYFVEDYKTSSRYESSYFEQWRMSNQMKGYAFLAGLLVGKPITGVYINLHVVRKADSQFERELIPFSQPILQEWRDNYNESVKDLQAAYEQERFRANYTEGGCAGKYGMCVYNSVCGVRAELREQMLARDFVFKPWNPTEADE